MNNYCLKPKDVPGKTELLVQMNFDGVSSIELFIKMLHFYLHRKKHEWDFA